MIHSMKTATVRDLRTSFPKVEAWLAEDGEVMITKGGKPVARLLAPLAPKTPDFAKRFGGGCPKPRQRKGAVDLLIEERGE
jgi:antitoxin (DNA-binding transcriptional repressor) of toxin-antitoxin stability system